MAYTIYHIPGIKIGCSKRIENRIKEQKFNEYEILEVHTDINIASIREKELNLQYGYEWIDTQDYRESARLSSELYCKDGSLKMDHILANCSLNLSPTRAVKDVSGGRELAAGNPCKNDSQCYSRNCNRGICGDGEPAAAGLTGFYYRYLDLFRPVL
jgi:hypothetical protein